MAGEAFAGSFLSGALNFIGNRYNNSRNIANQWAMNERNYNAQKEFYQNSIQWRKKDALNAGINPIYALGASSASFSPSYQATQENAPDFSFIERGLNNYIQAKQAQEQINLQKQEFKSSIDLKEAQVGTEQARQALLSAQTTKLLNEMNEEAKTPATTPTQATNKINNLLNKIQKPKSQIDFLNEILDPRKKAVVYANANGSYSVVYDDQSIRGQLYTEQQPGLLASAIPGGTYIADRIDMNRMSWELKDEYEKIARELEKQNPGKYAYIKYNTKSGIWEIHLKDDANTMKENLKDRLRKKGASEKYINSIK